MVISILYTRVFDETKGNSIGKEEKEKDEDEVNENEKEIDMLFCIIMKLIQ